MDLELEAASQIVRPPVLIHESLSGPHGVNASESIVAHGSYRTNAPPSASIA
jgi:hypothetical protein